MRSLRLRDLLISDAMHFIRDYIGLRSLQYFSQLKVYAACVRVSRVACFPRAPEALFKNNIQRRLQPANS